MKLQHKQADMHPQLQQSHISSQMSLLMAVTLEVTVGVGFVTTVDKRTSTNM